MPLPRRDDRIAQIANVIKTQHGHTISPENKGKNLNKFGTNTVVGTSFETIAQFQGTVSSETFVTTDLIDSIVSTSASDTSQTIVIEGHAVDVSGNLTFVIQEKLLTGQTAALLTTPIARVTRAYVKATGTALTFPTALVGTVYVYDNTGVTLTAGVPDIPAATKLVILAGATQSEKCATSISSADYWLLKYFGIGVGDAATSVDVVIGRIEVRDVAGGGAWRPLGIDLQATPTSGQAGVDLDFLQYVKPNHDVRVRAKTNAGSCAVFAEIGGVLATFT